MTNVARPVVAIVQARMSSTRLPGKVLRSFGGRTALEHLILRLRAVRRLDTIVVATTVDPGDDAIVDACRSLGIEAIRGSVDDVLSRYAMAARITNAATVVRATSDCPFFDPYVLEAMLACPADYEYLANTLTRTFPRGLDAEIVPRAVLDLACDEAEERYEREHVMPFLYMRPERFRLSNYARRGPSLGEWRWTLDTPEDLAFFEAVVDAAPRVLEDFSHEWLADVLSDRPDLRSINETIAQKPLEIA